MVQQTITDGMKCDAYMASVPHVDIEKIEEHRDEVIHSLDQFAQRFNVTQDEKPKLKGYATGLRWLDPEGTQVAAAFYGGSHHEHGVHIRVQGKYSPDIMQWIRATWPAHNVSRADVAIDYDNGIGTFNRLHDQCMAFTSDRPGIALDQRGDWEPLLLGGMQPPWTHEPHRRSPMSGRTRYIGSRDSVAFVRLYEKGLKSIKDTTPDLAKHISPTWVRLELQLQPDKRSKRLAATLSLDGMWAVSRWTRALLLELHGLKLEKVQMNPRTESDSVKAVRFMARQYRRHIQALLAEPNGSELLWEHIEAEWRDMDADLPFGPALMDPHTGELRWTLPESNRVH